MRSSVANVVGVASALEALPRVFASDGWVAAFFGAAFFGAAFFGAAFFGAAFFGAAFFGAAFFGAAFFGAAFFGAAFFGAAFFGAAFFGAAFFGAAFFGAAFFGAAFSGATFGLGFFVAGSFAEALALEVVGVFVFFADVLARAFGMHARYTETPRARAFVRASLGPRHVAHIAAMCGLRRLHGPSAEKKNGEVLERPRRFERIRQRVRPCTRPS